MQRYFLFHETLLLAALNIPLFSHLITRPFTRPHFYFLQSSSLQISITSLRAPSGAATGTKKKEDKISCSSYDRGCCLIKFYGCIQGPQGFRRRVQFYGTSMSCPCRARRQLWCARVRTQKKRQCARGGENASETKEEEKLKERVRSAWGKAV